MSAVAPTPALSGPSNGGVPARRAVIRWAGRMFRRDWRQQVLIVTLLTIAVAAAVASITIVYNTAPADNAEHGSASYILRFDGARPHALRAGLASARKFFGTIEVIGHRSLLVPGTVEPLDFRAQDPNGPFGHELLSLRSGIYPKGPHQVAVTDGAAELLRVGIGDKVGLDGHERRVVGIVENPRKLSDEFALVSPGSAGAPDHVTVLVDASKDSIDSWLGSGPKGKDTALSAFTGSESRSKNQAAETLAMFSVGTVFLLLTSLVAAAAFAVVAQRRLRQLGMLAAVGATQKHLRLVLLTHGALVGSIAGMLGMVAGLAIWLFAAPTLEAGIDHRVDRLSLPWTWIVLTVVLAILGATAAAWWPGRSVARLPVMLALSGRPPKPRPARHAAIAAVALIAVGVGSLVLSGRHSPPLIVAGIVATILGGLLLGPPAIRIFSRLAGRLSVAPRLALRDLVRYQARSGAALAAVTLALGIAATVAVIASAEAAQRGSAPPNLSDRQIRAYLSPPRAKEVISVTALNRVDRLAASVRKIAAELDGAAVTPLRKAIEPATPSMFDSYLNTRVLPPVDLAKRVGEMSYRPAAQLYVATPAVLRYLGIDPATIKPGTDFLADRSARINDLVIPSLTARREFRVTNVQRIEIGRHLFGAPYPADSAQGRTPPAFITLNGLRRHGWKQIPGGWLVESDRPLTSDQIARARDLAAEAGLTIEVRRKAPSYTKVIALAIGAGGLLALAILAMTVGLIRGESAGDLRMLTATGATSRIRRTLTATTAGALALLGALLGVAGSYVVLVATYHDNLGYLSDVPVQYLALAIVGVPLAAAVAGWLLAGREPPAIARPVIE